MGKNQHVLPRGSQWAVHGAGNSRDTSLHDTQAAAAAEARQIALNQGSEVVVHGRSGQIRSKDSFGRDPNPPKDREH